MKRVLYLLLILPLLNSCSGDDAPNSESQPQLTTNGTVLRKVNRTAPDFIDGGGLIYYIGNKLDKIGNATTYTKYIYTGNLITRMDYYQDSQLKSSELYTYDSSERLIQRKGLNYTNNTGFKTTYTFNPDGTCLAQVYFGDLDNQNTINEEKTRKVFFVNGKVDRIERYLMFGSNLETMTTAYAYDNKIDPYNIILGYNKLTFYELGSYGNPNNIVSFTYSATNSSIVDVDVIEYTYNSFEYPTTSKFIDPFDDGGPDIAHEFLYDVP